MANPLDQSTDDLVSAMHTIARLSTKKKVAEVKLRAACSLVAEKLAVLIGEPLALPKGYRIVNLDPMSDLTGAPPRPAYLVLTDARTSKGYVYTYALGPVPNDALDRFDFPPAGRLTLTKFAEAIQRGWLIDVANSIDIKTDRLAELIEPTEKIGKALS